MDSTLFSLLYLFSPAAWAIGLAWSVAVGFVWYSPLLWQGAWLRASGVDKLVAAGTARPIQHTVPMGVAVSAVEVAAIQAIALCTAAIGLLEHALVLGLLWVLVALVVASQCAWESRSASYFFIHAGDRLVRYAGLAVIIALF